MMKTLRVGFIGAGANTRKMHLPGFKAIEGVELCAVANRSRASSTAVAEAFGIASAVDDWRAIIADPRIDAVCIGTWPYLHAEASIAALEAGKHVLCEARMAADLEEARAMLVASKANPQLVAQVVPAPFSLNYDSKICELLNAGAIGDLLEVRVMHISGSLADPQAPMTWRSDRELSGKNILTMGILYETLLRWLGMDPEWLIADGAVFQDERFYPGSTAASKVEIPDSLSIVGRFAESAARFVYHFSGVESGPATMEFCLNGTKGSLYFDALNEKLFLREVNQSSQVEVAPDSSEGVGWQVESDFVNSIRTGAPVRLTSFEAGVRYMTFTEMVHDSLNAGGVRVAMPSY